ncbi:glycosyltransferase [Lutibacter sp. A80]|uniref:glycosyltransferase family 2 protein n=1 Tax=Lutibacter sp. A80 TaxID=2918453 RepID=UPI001F062383|nr:glycosyltransferase [Lutibacter sp. A80]UMB60334.1 glycosyltransferase [Lutibacter sp. A80]
MAEIPLVSVVMITYNHEKYIQKAIEGVLMQQCSFEVELIIVDDNSPDKTEEIVKKIIEEHPNSSCIKYTKHNENKGMMPNFIWALQQTKSKYIALCEGDDYWTDPLKLQKQVDFLEANMEYSLCFTAKSNIDINGVFINESRYGHQENWITKDVLNGSFIAPTQTIVSKNLSNDLINFLAKFPDSTGGDKLYTYFYATKGKLKYIDANTANYRVHSGGVWSGLNKKQQLIIHIREHLKFLEVVKKDKLHFKQLKRDMFRFILTRLYFSFFKEPLKTVNNLSFILIKYKIAPIVFLLAGKDFSLYYIKLLQSKFK